MSEDLPLGDELEELVGECVVLDTQGQYLYIGTLAKECDRTLILEEADVHDTRESHTSDELYILQAMKSGVRRNRHRVYVLARDVVSLSRLDDVVTY